MQLSNPIDPRTIPPGGSLPMAMGPATYGGKIILHNLSPYDLQLQFANDPSRQSVLFCWQPKEFDFAGHFTPEMEVSLMPVQCTGQANAPMFQLMAELFEPGEDVPDILPNYVRMANIANTIMASSVAAGALNDNVAIGTAPGTAPVPAGNDERVGVELFGGHDSGVYGAGNSAFLGSTSACLFKINNYWDGTADRFIIAATNAYQFFITSNGILHYRKDDGTNHVAGGAITWLVDFMTLDTGGNLSANTFKLIFGGELIQDNSGTLQFLSRGSGAAVGILCTVWNGSSFVNAFSVGSQIGSAPLYTDTLGTLYATTGLNYGVGVGGFFSNLRWDNANNVNVYWTPQNGSANGHVFVAWNGSAQVNVLGVGGAFAGALSSIDNSGNFTGNTFKANGPASSSYFLASIPSTVADQNAVLNIVDNTTGAVNWQVGKQSHANGDNWRVVDATNAIAPISIAPLTGNITISGLLLETSGRHFHPSGFFNGTGAGTFSHGLGVTPQWVGITEDVVNSTMTVGVDTLGSSTVHVNVGVAGQAWIGIATN